MAIRASTPTGLRRVAVAAAILLLSRCGVAESEELQCEAEGASCDAPASTGTAPRKGDPGVVLIQLNSADVTKTRAARGPSRQQSFAQESRETPSPQTVPPSDSAGAIASLTNQVSELKEMLTALQLSLGSKMDGCCGERPPCGYPPSSDVSNEENKPGLCAVFGDPHFSTFDGAHTIWLKEMTLWMVKSSRVWVQAYSSEATGNLMGIAIGGPFMKGHSLILYNSTEHGRLRAMYDGKEILEDVDDEGNAEFQDAFRLWAARRDVWDSSLHDEEILEMHQPVNFSVAPWPDRFQGSPLGGLFLFRLPNNIELTATGVDFMSAVIKMTPESSGQSGFCGNFNGDPDDEFIPADNGTVPEILRPAWNRPWGQGLEAVEDKYNLFLRVPETEALVNHAMGILGTTLAQLGDTPLAQMCKDEDLQKAEEECGPDRDWFKWQSCMVDICLTGKHSAASDSAAAELLEERVNHRGIPVFVGHGRCKDAEGKEFEVLRAKGVRSFRQCMSLLRDLASVDGVVGAQIQLGDGCEILTDPGVDMSAVETLKPPEGWEVDEASGNEESSEGHRFVAGVSEDLRWSCWRLN